jgi:serine/threonine protein phosphatase PrpC
LQYQFYGVSLQNKRPSNMDSLLLKCSVIQSKNALLALVCDGVGSMASGAFASGEATRMLGEWFTQANASTRVGLDMRDAILQINRSIISQAKTHKIDTATTLSAILLIEQTYYITHIGDSRIYCYDSRQADERALSILTHDDLSPSGKLTACIGQTEDVFPQCAEGNAEGKTFLVCSDGLYNRMDLGIIAAAMKNWSSKALKEPADALTRYAIERGEQDNITIAMAKTVN